MGQIPVNMLLPLLQNSQRIHRITQEMPQISRSARGLRLVYHSDKTVLLTGFVARAEKFQIFNRDIIHQNRPYLSMVTDFVDITQCVLLGMSDIVQQ